MAEHPSIPSSRVPDGYPVPDQPKGIYNIQGERLGDVIPNPLPDPERKKQTQAGGTVLIGCTDHERRKQIQAVGTVLMGCTDLPDYSPHRCCFGCHGYGDAYPHKPDVSDLEFVSIALIIEHPPVTPSSLPTADGLQPESQQKFEKIQMTFLLCCQARRNAPSTVWRRTVTANPPRTETS